MVSVEEEGFESLCSRRRSAGMLTMFLLSAGAGAGAAAGLRAGGAAAVKVDEMAVEDPLLLLLLLLLWVWTRWLGDTDGWAWEGAGFEPTLLEAVLKRLALLARGEDMAMMGMLEQWVSVLRL